VNRILKPVTYVLAAVYFLVDAVFIAVAKPVSDWLAKHLVLRKLRAWIRSLRPYPSLALFSVPVIILEPVNRADEKIQCCAVSPVLRRKEPVLTFETQQLVGAFQEVSVLLV
jgi:hypothetical protein